MNIRVLLILIAVAAGVWLWRRGKRVSSDAGAPRQSSARPQPMLSCARCGIHLPASQATLDHQGRAYCCPAHRQQMQS